MALQAKPSETPTVRSRLADAILVQQGEVDRLMAQVKNELPAAKAKLDALKALAGQITPEFEALAAQLETAHVIDIT